ncbi:urease accessory protein UreF [Bizionia gelidisalsuginis]|uniref:Urease accessory protein UreF n=1 Tax=Bizionia gelidisalsuginis TaxID=291188 RepID=A0ABY3M9M1_9FLAO|nr:urease accessory protein UreF [Bizionia gelidisalsuginis]TYC11434.1 urease accessory protein UreF [Bizionia gelidisalsuginis]
MANNKQKILLELLHISDPTLPIGGYSHSNGLETYIQQNVVRDVESTREFVQNMLLYNFKYNDGVFVRDAFRYGLENNLEALLELDNEAHALKAPMEVRDGSLKLGTRLLKIYVRLHDYEVMHVFFNKVKNKETPGHFAVVFGMITALLGAEIKPVLSAFYYNAAVNMVTNSVKLVPLGQMDGQDILYKMHDLIAQVVDETLILDEDMRGLCNPAFDIRCMQHETLYSRLYMS